jgi:hypothetical protein
VNPSDLWWQALADGPVLLALFDADGRLRLAHVGLSPTPSAQAAR